MIFDDKQFNLEFSTYSKFLELFSSLSNVFSASDAPYLHYRIMEKVFCNSFDANDLSRLDTAFDANKIIDNVNYGIGLKTFATSITKNGPQAKQEKIAEFNKESTNLQGLSIYEMTNKIAELRNARLLSAIKEYSIDKSIYHCAIRYNEHNSAKVLLKEYPYEPIVLSKIICTDKNYNPLSFSEIHQHPDNILYFMEEGTNNFYSFNRSKSTLLKRFDTSSENGLIIPVKIIDDPYGRLLQYFPFSEQKKKPGVDYVVLPLYSKKDHSLTKYVPEKSGLNQWNAGGRKRAFGEMYIPVPAFVRHHCANFFPERKKEFILLTPNNKEISASLCQDNGKALMSNPNKSLSQWFHSLLIKDNQQSIITYSDLSRIGKDSVIIEKISDYKFKFSLAPLESWENFQQDINKLNGNSK